MLNLLDFFKQDEVYRNINFQNTYCPFAVQNNSIGYAANDKVIKLINEDENIVGVITTDEFKELINKKKGVVISNNPQLSYYNLHNTLVDSNLLPPLHETKINESVTINKSAVIYDNVYIGNNVTIGHGVIIYENSYIGDNTVIEDYAIIGAKGMQNTTVNGVIIDLQYAGGVKIGENCHILSNAIIQRPYQRFYTHINDNAKISVKVVVGHGCTVGKKTMIAGNSQIAGNVQIGNNVWVGPSCTFVDNVKIGDNASVRIGSVVVNDIKEGENVSGNFAYSHKRHLLNFTKERRKKK